MVLLLAPLAGHPAKSGGINDALKFVDISGVNSILELLVFGMKPLDRLLMFTTIIGMACVQRLSHPFENLVVEVQPAQQLVNSFSSSSSRTNLLAQGARLPWPPSTKPVQ